MKPDQPDWALHVDTVAQSIGLPIEPAYRAGVIENFARIAQVAEGFLSFPLADTAEPAPRFEP